MFTWKPFFFFNVSNTNLLYNMNIRKKSWSIERERKRKRWHIIEREGDRKSHVEKAETTAGN